MMARIVSNGKEEFYNLTKMDGNLLIEIFNNNDFDKLKNIKSIIYYLVCKYGFYD